MNFLNVKQLTIIVAFVQALLQTVPLLMVIRTKTFLSLFLLIMESKVFESAFALKNSVAYYASPGKSKTSCEISPVTMLKKRVMTPVRSPADE